MDESVMDEFEIIPEETETDLKNARSITEEYTLSNYATQINKAW